MTGRVALVLATAVCCSAASAAEPKKGPPDVDILKHLRHGHPRLIALEADMARAKEMIAREPMAKDYHQKLRLRATRMLKKPLLKYEVVGPRLLHISRRCVDRVYALALMHRLDGDAVFADRAIQEMLNVCAFKDWHPSHFLDTAEMTHAVAIGYDWLYDRLSPEQRETIVEGIVRHGLLAAKPFYDKQRWWVRCHHNWNQVCNGGIVIGALAVADERPKLAAYVIEQSRTSIARAMRSYEPDGGWAEGPGYWHYATRYNVYYLAALATALDTDLGLMKEFPGFAKAGDFRVYFVGPIHKTFNYADAGSNARRAHEMFWLARTFDRPLYAWHERTRPGRPDPLDLLWFDPRGRGPKAMGTPLDRAFAGVDVAFLRSAWEDRDAVFVGFKGGDNRANHAHLDLGTFVLDALGRRWALDLGGDYYNLPGYFGGKRWTYYRLRTEGHNTLTLDGENQRTGAKAPLVAFRSTKGRAYAVADLSKAYAEAKTWRRGVALLDRREVLVQDEIELAKEADVAWTMHTRATLETDGATATLRQGNDRLRAVVIEPDGARFETASATPPEPQAQNEGVTRLLIRLPGVSQARIAVLLTPYRGAAPAAPSRAVRPLSEWIAAASEAGR
ncbi:MAG: heparinase II/III domain-containing protein [Planctomycetota bacterium]